MGRVAHRRVAARPSTPRPVTTDGACRVVSDTEGLRPDHREMDHVMRRRRRRAMRGITTIVLVVLVVAFVIQNSQLVTVHFWFVTHKAHLIWVVLACLVAGIVVGLHLGRARASEDAPSPQGRERGAPRTSAEPVRPYVSGVVSRRSNDP